MSIDLPATVSQYADAAGVSVSTVRRSLDVGTLIADEKAKPTLIVGGELSWTIDEWKRRISPAIAGIKPGLRGFDGDGNLHILRGTSVVIIPRGRGEVDLRSAERAIERALADGTGVDIGKARAGGFELAP